MEQKLYFDPAEHQAKKQRQRNADAAALASGAVSRRELALSNGLFSSPIIGKIQIVKRFGRS